MGLRPLAAVWLWQTTTPLYSQRDVDVKYDRTTKQYVMVQVGGSLYFSLAPLRHALMALRVVVLCACVCCMCVLYDMRCIVCCVRVVHCALCCVLYAVCCVLLLCMCWVICDFVLCGGVHCAVFPCALCTHIRLPQVCVSRAVVHSVFTHVVVVVCVCVRPSPPPVRATSGPPP
jgi:hypothetical protein